MKNTIEIGDLVKIRDEEELPSEWAIFLVKNITISVYEIVPVDRIPCYDNDDLLVFRNEIIPWSSSLN